MAINKDLKALLQTEGFSQIKDPELLEHADD